MSDNPRAVAGDNNPPEPTLIEAARELVSSLSVEAEAWFDGTPIENQAQADDVARLLDAARKAGKQFDADRKAEKKPHEDAGKAVDAAWKPVIADADRILEIAKAAQTTWLVALDKEKRAREDAARAEAAEKLAEARKLTQQAPQSLADAKARDAAIEAAKAAEAAATRAAADKAGAKGQGMARTVSLRTTWRSQVEDRRALLNHVARTAPADLDAFLAEWAARAVRSGARDLPGVAVWSEKAAA